MSRNQKIPEHIRSGLEKAVCDRYPDLPMITYDIGTNKGGGYSATVTLENQSRNADGSTNLHGILSAIFEYRNQWRMTNDWND